MCCTFVPPYLLQRVALWAGTRHASDSGRETLQVDDRLRARREAPAGEMAAPRLPGTKKRVVHTANNTESLPGEVVRSNGDPAVGAPRPSCARMPATRCRSWMGSNGLVT